MSHHPRVVADDSKQQLKAVQCEKNDPDKVLEPLEKLCMSLVMGVERYLRGFDAATAIPLLLRMTEKEAFAFRGDSLTMIFRALSLIMEHVPSSYESVQPYHKRLMSSVCCVLSQTLLAKMKYSNTDNVMLLEESLRLIRFITKDESKLSIFRFGVSDILRIASSENTLLARQAFDVLLVICSKVIFPSDMEKRHFFSLPSFLTGGRKNKKNMNAKSNNNNNNSNNSNVTLLESNEKPCVFAVENSIVPFLHVTLQQYAASLESFPEAWTFLELTLQCLCMLLRRCMLCHRPSTARKIVTREMYRILFKLLLFNDSNVALDHTVRSERLLLCETVLDAAMTTDAEAGSESLLGEEAISFYKLLLDEPESGIIAQLDDPFPVSGMASRNTQRRDKNNIVSIAAIRLFILACPRVPSEAYGPRPKVLLPVHQWMWEDEMRHNNAITEEGCVALETSFSKLSKDSSFRMYMKDLSVDFHTMKMTGGFRTAERNVSRKVIPFVFHFVDEANLSLVKSAKETLMSFNKKMAEEEEELTAQKAEGVMKRRKKLMKTMRDAEAIAAAKKLSHLFLINKATVALPVYMHLAEMFLEDLCNFVVSASGQMAMQLGIYACASLLQAAILTGEDDELKTLLTRIMCPLCKMLCEALTCTDKATKSLALTMMVWLACHPHTSTWKFSETALRSGAMNQLEILSALGGSGGEKVVKTQKKHAEKAGAEVYQSRAAYLAASATAIKHAINEDFLRGKARPAAAQQGEGSAAPVVDVCMVRNAVEELQAAVVTPGLHREMIENILDLMEKSINTVTPYEVSTLGIAGALLNYLIGENCKDYARVNGDNTDAANGGDGAGEKEQDLFLRGLNSEEEGAFTLGGKRTGIGLHRRCHKERLQCFLDCVMKKPRGVKTLIENLVAALPLHFPFPLVETLLGPFRVSCRPPMKAVLAGSSISPIVSLCSKKEVGSDNVHVGGAEDCAERRDSRGMMNEGYSFPALAPVLHLEAPFIPEARASGVSPRDYCPQGHRLLPIARSTSRSLCELCEEEVTGGVFCHHCEFYLCKECHRDPAAQYRGNSVSITSNNGNGDEAGGGGSGGGYVGLRAHSQPRQQRGEGRQRYRQELQHQHQQVKPVVRAHLFSSIGDIERYFRTGSYSTKNTDTAPAPQSALRNVDCFVKRAQSYLARKDVHYSYKVLRQEVTRILNSYSIRGPIIDTADIIEDGSEESTLDEKDLKELHRLLHDAIEERYILYTSPGGRCPYQETLIGNFLQRAFDEGHLGVIEQLENCLLHIEGTLETSNSTLMTDLRQEEVLIQSNVSGIQRPPSDLPDWSGNAQVYTFHHFQTDQDTHCLCGRTSRKELNSVYPPKFVRKPSQLSQNSNTLLLILLHTLLSPLIKQRAVDIDFTVFVSVQFTTLVVKSLAASALRVALLPPRLAVPRWADFVITEASFLLPLNVRERVARFFAYGARRALQRHLKPFPTNRLDRSIKIYSAEWGLWTNHKYRVNREELLHDACKVLHKSADSRLPMSIEFEGDVGVGQGPTAHFYTLVAEEVKKAELNLWRSDGFSSDYTNTNNASEKGKRSESKGKGSKSPDATAAKEIPPAEGLYPSVSYVTNPQCLSAEFVQRPPQGATLLTDRFICLDDYAEVDRERARCYYLIGAILGRAFTDEVVFPLDLSPALAVFLSRGVPSPYVVLSGDLLTSNEVIRPIDFMGLSLDDVALVDQSVAASLRSLKTFNAATLDSLSIPFTLPGHDKFDLIPDGADNFVTPYNLAYYTRRVASVLLYESAVFAMRFLVCGFRDVVPAGALASLDASEAMSLLCGCRTGDTTPLWTLAEIRSILVADHGYQNDSPQMTMLQNILANRLTPAEQRTFLLFCTGCPRLPFGGVGALGAITVVRRSDLTVFRGSQRRSSSSSINVLSGSLNVPGDSGLLSEQDASVKESAWPLPSVNTCFRYLKLPPYPTEELMYKKLRLSISQGGETFQLS